MKCGRNAHNNTVAHLQAAVSAQRLADEVLDHLLGDFDVGDHAVAKRPDRLNRFGCLAQHQLGFVSYGPHASDAIDRFDCDDRRFVKDDAFFANVHERVHGTEIDGQIVLGQAQQAEKVHLGVRCLIEGMAVWHQKNREVARNEQNGGRTREAGDETDI